jgi:hypothetical protein
MRHAQRIQRADGVTFAAAQDAQEDVLRANGWLAKRLGFVSSELDTAPSFAGDKDFWAPRVERVKCLFSQVTVLTVRGLLADPECPGDLAPGCARLQGALNQDRFDLLEFLS